MRGAAALILSDKIVILSDMTDTRPQSTPKKKSTPAHRGTEEALRQGSWQSRATLGAAKAAGFLGGAKSERVGGRVSRRLISAAKAKSGIDLQTELLEYALSKVALEDDFGKKLLARKGSVPDDVEL